MHNIIGTIYDADRRKAWMGANDHVYRWFAAGQYWTGSTEQLPDSPGIWCGIHASDMAAEAHGETVYANCLIYRCDAPIAFERQGPYIEVSDLDNLLDRQAILNEEPLSDFERWLGMDKMPRP